MATLNFLYRREFEVTEHIRIYIPTVEEVLENEDAYYSMVSMLTAMPIDMMVQLDEAGIDFTKINDYDLFIMFFPALQKNDASLIFGKNSGIEKFELVADTQSNSLVFRNPGNGAVLDRYTQIKIANVLRKLHNIEKNTKKPANNEAKEFMLERAKTKAERSKKHKRDSQLEELIVAMVNTPEFHYDFEGVRTLSIYQFNESVRQVIKKIDYDNIMHGVYSGTVSAKDLNSKDLNWLTHK